MFTIQIQSNLAGLISLILEAKKTLRYVYPRIQEKLILESKETVVGNVHLTVTLSIKYSAKTKVQPKVPLYE